MLVRVPQIVAFGGGGFSMEWGNTLLDDFVLELTGAERPRVCFLPTASGDADHYVVRFYRASRRRRCEPSHISLFRRETGVGDPGAPARPGLLLMSAAEPRVAARHLAGARSRQCCCGRLGAAGVVLCGGSAGSLCWFAQAVSAFHEGAPTRDRGRSGCCPGAERGPLRRRGAAGAAKRSCDAVADGSRRGSGAGDSAPRFTSSAPSWRRS